MEHNKHYSENILQSVSIWGSEVVGLVAHLGYLRQGS
jgi:hypothetical protein